jgi:peptide subunit release factor 1 (eRF1)
MEMPAQAGYVDARPLLAENLRRLGELHPEVPVLSLLLDLNPADFGTQRARKSAYTSLLDEAHRRVEAYDTDHEGRLSLRADVERAAAFFDEYEPDRGRGAAIFGASAVGIFEPYTLPRSPRTQVMIGESAYIAPLVEAADMRDWLIVLVDTRHGRFLHGNTDHIEEFERVEDSVPGRHERSGPTDHQRWVEHHVDQHLRKVAHELDARLGSGRYDRVLIGGPPEIAPRFAQHHMSNPARERLAGRFEVEVPDTVPDDVRKAAIRCFEEDERRHERELLDRLAERLGRGERAAAGMEAVREKLEMAAVETLLYDRRSATGAIDTGELELAIEQAVTQAAEVLPVRHHPDELAQRGHIAALTRF